MVKGWNVDGRQKLRDDVPRLGFAAEIGGRNVLTLAQETLRFAARGLAKLSKTNETRALLGSSLNSSR